MRRHQTGTNVHPARSKLPGGIGVLARIAGNDNGSKLKPNRGAQFQDCHRDMIEQALLAACDQCNVILSESTWMLLCPALVAELKARIPGLCPQGRPKQENHDADT